jgi:uncharacterized OsmC-like protein
MSVTAETLQPNVVNGIDVDAVAAMAAEIAEDSAKAMTHWHVHSTWQGQTHSRTEVASFYLAGTEVKRRFTIDIDEPVELCGSNAHANPQEHLLASLNACMMVGYVALAAMEGIRIESLAIETEGDIDLRGFLGMADVAPGYERLRYTVSIKGDGTDEQFQAIHEKVMATSPNFYNLSRAVTLNPTLVVG